VKAGAVERVLVTGAAGMLGSEVVRRAPARVACVATDVASAPGVDAPGVDLADEAAVARLWAERGPFDGVIHCAAYTAVDRAESEAALARRVNVDACAVLARRCARDGARLVAVGTDFVFDGAKRAPYVEDDPPAPLSVYGRTKLDGEREALAAHPSGTAIVRTQWLYGPRGQHFPRTIVRLAREKGRLRVVDDQVGSPTSTLELAPALWDVLLSGANGVYHAACEGACSWHGFTRAILDLAQLGATVLEPCATAEFPRPARRPAYSVLDSSRLAALRGRRLAPWRAALADYLAVEPL
jgi:dTDP-4-dehydrorhamnose reductase